MSSTASQNSSTTIGVIMPMPKNSALTTMTKGLARVLAPRIRVNAIAPGYVGTPMVKGMDQGALAKIVSGVHLGRLIEPDEIADAIAWVVSNDAVNATCIEVAGGMILDAAKPWLLVSRSVEPLLQAETEAERSGIVPNVVFPTAIVEIDGNHFVFYGMADSTIGVARLVRS